jgi:cyclic beta-1,2-glucan synthetase
MSHWALGLRVDSSRSQFLLISGSSGVLLAILAWRQSPWEPAWTPFLLLWVAAPAVGHWIGSQRRAVRRLGRIGPDDRLYLRRLARETWRFFDDLVGPEHHYLPPDNSQEALRVEVAGRTSPTNIGMWLTSAVSARDFGWLTPEELVELCQSTMDTLEGLERCEGHLLNWYNTRTLEPLSPKYVSTVDSGNLIASLWVLAQSMEELERSPLLDGSAIRGLNDTRSIIMERFESDHTTAAALETLEDLFRERPSTLEVVERIRLAGEPARKLTESLRWSASEERTYWFQRLERQIETWTGYFDRYLRWVEILAAPPDRFLEPLGEHAIRARRRILRQWPTLGELASGASDVPGLLSESVEPSEEDMPQNLVRWLDELGTAYRCARTEAQSLVERARRLARLAEETADGMNMRFLFDNRRRLFAIGYHVGDPLTFTSHYDLLASEARLSSLVAIAKGDAPLRHWLALGRPYTSSNGQVLLSWNGAMFEYLMPLLFTRTFRNSLLEDACLAALRCQIEYAEKRRVPWGISESAHSAVDVHRIYQYRAFGAPALALRRGAESDLVVAPYATVLALLVDPVAAVRNLRRLEKAGVHGRMGFYDALDFTVQRERHGKKGVVVYTYMAHHQGMSLTAINIVLNDDVMRRRFHADRRIKAVEPLLFERVPPQASLLVHQKSDEGRTRPESEAPPPQLRVLDENTPVPRVHLLGNGRYSVMITSSGAGYSRWGRFDISRWRSDPTTDEWGMVIYMRDRDTGTIWSATHHPLGVKDTRFTAIFSADRAEFRRRRRGVESHLEVTVSPEDDVEVRRLTLTNRGLRSRSLDFISAVEISLAPHEADRAHQAFSKLFIRTEAIPEMKALLAWRRLRSESEPPIWTAQIVVDSENGRGFEFETDRATFIGRGRGWRDPAMSIEGTEGYVLDPVLVIKRSVDLEPRQERRLTVVTVAAASREEALRLIAKYSDPVICNRTFEVAWSHAHLEYRYLGIRSDAAFRFNELASHLLYPNSRLRAPSSRLARNTLGQSKLWAYGVSGDLPIAVVSVAESEGLRLVREVLVAHTYWRLHGFLADLIILNRESADYEQPVQRQLERLIAAHSLHTGVDKPGGVFLRRADHIPEDALNLILTVAAATLGAVRGPLSRQLTSSPEPSLPAPLIVKKQDEEVSAPLPFLELPYFNGLGGFTADGREYAVYLGPGVSTPLPWINVMSNATFGTFLSESGSGCTWYGNSHSNRLTPWTNDPVSDPATEAVYVRDEETGSFWTPTALPVRELDAYRARHGQGYTVFEHNSHALELELLAFVPVDGNGGDPVRLQRLKIRNASGRRKRRLSVTAYSELVLSEHCETTRMHIRSSWDDESKALLARNPYHRAYPDRPAFLAMEPEATSFTGDRTEFLGRYGSTKHPAAMSRESLSNRTGVGFDPCGALQTKFDLLPGEEKVVILMLGQARDMPEARSLVARYRDPIEVERAIGETRRWWDDLLDTIQVETPVLSVNFLMNRWLIYQTLSCRIWGRTALYQSSGAFGFRDQLQDGLALVHADAKIARQMILTAASRQFIEGDVQHWWHLPSGEGIRSRCSDDLLWLPFAVCHYVEATGDREILGTTIAFLDGPPLGADELESYFQPEVSTESASLYEHCRRAIEKGLTAGPQGLPLIGTGDWNDGMNSVGDEGRGESVWLAWFLIDVLNSFARLSDEYGDPRQADEYRRRSLSLAETVERTSWDGAWYLRAFFDDLSPLGSRDNPEASIDSLSQSWAVISGAAAPERASEAMRSVARLLVKKEEKLVLLNTPPFEHSTPNPGYIQGYPPGVRENGGQYTHGALWVAKAFARMGNGDRAVEVLQMLNPVEHARTPTECLAYGTEPYAVAADVYSLESRPGRGGWTWYTGSAGWMYRVWLEDVLGFRLRRDRLTMEPVLPAEWPGFTMTFRYGRTRYRIIVENGQRISPKEFVLEDDGRDHEIRVHPDPPAAA